MKSSISGISIYLKLIAIFITCVIPFTPAKASIDVRTICFSNGGKHPIRFEFKEYSDRLNKTKFAFVKYEKSKSWIPLIFGGDVGEQEDPDAPAVATTTWFEITNKKLSGTYELTGQGTMISSMLYRKISSPKEYSFVMVSAGDSSAADRCDWAEQDSEK